MINQTLEALSIKSAGSSSASHAIDFESTQGRFGWAKIMSVSIPFIFRRGVPFTSVRIFETHVLRQSGLNVHTAVFEYCFQGAMSAFTMTWAECRLFDEINGCHCDGQYGRQFDDRTDHIFRLDDAALVTRFIMVCFTVSKGGRSLDNMAGFVRINDDVVPYALSGNTRYAPAFCFEDESGFLRSNKVIITGPHAAFLKLGCYILGIRQELVQGKGIAAVDLESIRPYLSDEPFPDVWPNEAMIRKIEIVGPKAASMKWIVHSSLSPSSKSPELVLGSKPMAVLSPRLQICVSSPQVTAANIQNGIYNTANMPELVAFRPKELEASPKELAALPKQLEALPKELEALPKELEALPKELEALPKELEAVPRALEAVPMKLKVVSKEVKVVPGELEAVTKKLTRIPKSAVPKGLVVAQKELAALPNKPIRAPEEPTATQNKPVGKQKQAAVAKRMSKKLAAARIKLAEASKQPAAASTEPLGAQNELTAVPRLAGVPRELKASVVAAGPYKVHAFPKKFNGKTLHCINLRPYEFSNDVAGYLISLCELNSKVFGGVKLETLAHVLLRHCSLLKANKYQLRVLSAKGLVKNWSKMRYGDMMVVASDLDIYMDKLNQCLKNEK